ncbi:MAG: type I DNA topoisomerase [Bacillota bacterium]|nr:type I DNA topoisomerase [Bacillota bacterium]
MKSGSRLVIVESPAKAKTIGKFMGDNYYVSATNGHVRDLPQNQLGVDVLKGFEPKYVTLKGRGEILERIREEAKAAERVYLATDPDREGEAISWHIAQALDIPEEEMYRIEFNEITQQAIRRALESPRKIDINLVNAQQARRILDRLVGYKISPLLWRKVRKGLSAGRVQSVAVRIICDREKEIEDFIPREFWTISTFLLKDEAKKPIEAAFFGKGNDKIELKDEKETLAVIDGLAGASYIVTEVKKGTKAKHAPPPFTTSTMQQEASRKFGFTASKTMLVAQQLYEGVEVKGHGAVGLVTYIRTDSVRVASEAQAEAREYVKANFGEKYAPGEYNFYRGKKGIQDAHEAIRPTSLSRAPDSVKDSLTGDQYKLYKLIFERFVASQMAEAIYDTLLVTICANGYAFKASGLKTVFPGFTASYRESNEHGDEHDVILPQMDVGEVLKLQSLKHEQHFTKPPQRYTEASLVKTLEEKGIGRPSTYAPIITTIIDRGYVLRENKALCPTELGRVVNELMKEYFMDIVNVEFTAGMEEKLDDIEEGKKEWREVLSEFYMPFENTLKLAETRMGRVKLPDEVSSEVCPNCGSQMVIKMGRYGKFLACPKYPECRATKAYTEKAQAPCPLCGKSVLKLKSKRNKQFFRCEDISCKFISWYPPVSERCAKCGSPMVLKRDRNNRAYCQCMNEVCKHRAYPSAGKKEQNEQQK